MSNDISNHISVPLIDTALMNIEVEVPLVLRPVFAANRHLLPRFARVVSEAVQKSFEHPDTRLKGEIRREEVKLRVNLCYEALRQMYYEEKISIIHALDILPQTIIDALRMGAKEPGDLIDGRGGNRWGVPGSVPLIGESDGNDLNE